jgi:hypothetical protein
VSARGEWKPGGSARPGSDAYGTSKQCNLATVIELAREIPRLHFNAFEPGFNPGTGLGREAGGLMRFVLKYILPPLAPFKKNWSSPKRTARVVTKILVNGSGRSGVYYDDRGSPMLASAAVSDPKFQDRVVAETRALLSKLPA